MKTIEIEVSFPAHLSRDSMESIISQLEAYGNTNFDEANKKLFVSIFRPSHFPKLEKQLVRWDLSGSLTWRELQ